MKKLFLISAILIVVILKPAYSKIYKIDNNYTGEKLLSQPVFKTLEQAVAILAPGDTLFVSGEYSEPLIPRTSGTLEARIKIQGNPYFSIKGTEYGAYLKNVHFLDITNLIYY